MTWRGVATAALALTASCSHHSVLELGQPTIDGAGAAASWLAMRAHTPDGRLLIEPASELDFSDHVTVETWVFPHSARGGSLFCKIDATERKVLRLRESSLAVELAFRMSSEPSDVTLVTLGGLRVESWHHVAVSYARGALLLFIDGELAVETRRMDPIVDGSGPAAWGWCDAEPSLAPADVSFSDVRISRVGRYSEPFAPESRFQIDASASALFPLTDGVDGTVAEMGPYGLSARTEGNVSWPSLPPR